MSLGDGRGRGKQEESQEARGGEDWAWHLGQWLPTAPTPTPGLYL